MRNQSRHVRQPASISRVIAAHCSTIRRKTTNLDAQKLSAILNDVVRELNTTTSHSATYYNSLNEIVLTLNGNLPPSLASLTSHYFFILLRNTIQVLLQEIHTKHQLNQQTIYVLRNCIVLLEHVVKRTSDVSKILHWITDITFVDALANCLNQIDKISKVNASRLLIKQITRSLDIFIHIQERLPSDLHNSLFARLLQPVINCLTSSAYVDTFKSLKVNSTAFTAIQKLLLAKCPRFVATYNGPHMEETIEQTLEVMLPRHVSILDTHVKTIKKWRRSIKRALYHLLTNLVFAEGYFTTYLNSQLLQTFINHLLRLVNESTFVNNIHRTSKNFDSMLIDAALQVFNVLVNEPDALDYLKQCKPGRTFQRLAATPGESIASNACTILAYTIYENDMKESHTYFPRLLCTILKLLDDTIQSVDQNNGDLDSSSQHINRNIIQLTQTLTSLLQHEQVKSELIKQDALPFLIKSAQQLTGRSKQHILESLWTLSFDKQIAQQIADNTHFILSLQNITKHTADANNEPNTSADNSPVSWNQTTTTTTSNGLHAVADGLLWNVVKESRARENPPKTTGQTHKYDMIISYSVNDKEAAHQIQQTLVNEGFIVWLDDDVVHRPSMETVVERINNSTVMIVCLSESYKRDNRCRAECVYASDCKRLIVPVVVQKRLEIDGWLTLMTEESACIEFDIVDLKRSSAVLIREINRHCSKKRIDDKTTAIMPTKDVHYEERQQTFGRAMMTPTPSGRTSVLPDKQQQQPTLSRPNSRSNLPTVTPVSITPLLATANYHKYLPEEYTKRDTSDAKYRSMQINNWKKKDTLDFLYDSALNLMMPLCESMTGRALLGFYQICQRKPSRVHSQLNEELRDRFHGITLPMGIYTQFLIEVDNLLDAALDRCQVSPSTFSNGSQRLLFMSNPTQSHVPTMQSNYIKSRPSIMSPALLRTAKSMETNPEVAPFRSTRVVERAIFRPASAASRPYDFVVETGEESSLLLEQIERYAPQLFLLQQQAHEYRQMHGPQ